MYSVEVGRRAERDIARLPQEYARLVGRQLDSFSENPRPRGARRLRGQSVYRLRVGTYRVLYRVDDTEQVVYIERVAHRRDAYRLF